MSSVSVRRIVGALRFRLSSRPSSRLSFRPSARLGVSGLLRLVRSSRAIVSQGVSCFSSCSLRRQLCLIRHRLSGEGVFASVSSWVSGWVSRVEAMGFVACFLLYSYTRRFPQLRFPSWRGVGCPSSRCGVACPSSFPCVVVSASSLFVLRRLVSASRPSVCSSARFVSPVGRPVSLIVPVASSASSWGERLIHMVFSLSTRAVFLSSFSHLFPIAIVVGKHPSE